MKNGKITIEIDNSDMIASTLSIRMDIAGPMDIFNAAMGLFKAIPDDQGKALFLKQLMKKGYDDKFIEKYTMSDEQLSSALNDLMEAMAKENASEGSIKDILNGIQKEIKKSMENKE